MSENVPHDIIAGDEAGDVPHDITVGDEASEKVQQDTVEAGGAAKEKKISRQRHMRKKREHLRC